MSLMSVAFRNAIQHSEIGWSQHSLAVAFVQKDTREFAANLMGYAASAAVLGTFLMRRMVPLRLLAILSNILFVAYGYAEHIYPVLWLHVVLLPINAQRLLTSAGGPKQIRVCLCEPFQRIASLRRRVLLFALGLISGSAGVWLIVRILATPHA